MVLHHGCDAESGPLADPVGELPASRATATAAADSGVGVLTESECLDLLATAEVGRIGVTLDALPAIFPVNYRLVAGDLVFRTAPGTKLRAALNRTVVAFEVDHIDHARCAGWSILVVGVAEEIDSDEAADLDIDVTPWASGERSHTIRIHPEIVTGRRIAQDGPAGSDRPTALGPARPES